MKKLKLMTILGTRPEIIRLSAVMRCADRYFDHIMMVVILAIAGLLIAVNMKIGYPRFGKLQKALDRLNNVSREFLSSIRVVKAFNAEKQEGDKFESASQNLAGAGVSAMRVMAVFSPLINLTVNMPAEITPGSAAAKQFLIIQLAAKRGNGQVHESLF